VDLPNPLLQITHWLELQSTIPFPDILPDMHKGCDLDSVSRLNPMVSKLVWMRVPGGSTSTAEQAKLQPDTFVRPPSTSIYAINRSVI
jgi:hypothetical protein